MQFVSMPATMPTNRSPLLPNSSHRTTASPPLIGFSATAAGPSPAAPRAPHGGAARRMTTHSHPTAAAPCAQASLTDLQATTQTDTNATAAPNTNSSQSNAMPGHGANVHYDALVPSGISMFVEWPCAATTHTNSTSSSAQHQHPTLMTFRHDAAATTHTLRASCLPFERGTDMTRVQRDLQAIANAVCSYHCRQRRGVATGSHPTELAYSNPLNVVVLSARKAAKGHSVEATIRTSQPRLFAQLISEAVVLADRKGFHIAFHETSSAATPSSSSASSSSSLLGATYSTRQQLLKYCETVRNMPQKQRHWCLDGLPCSTIGLRVEGLAAAISNVASPTDEKNQEDAAARVIANRGDKNYRHALVVRSQMKAQRAPTTPNRTNTPPPMSHFVAPSTDHRRPSSSASSSSQGSLGVSGGSLSVTDGALSQSQTVTAKQTYGCSGKAQCPNTLSSCANKKAPIGVRDSWRQPTQPFWQQQ